MAEELKQVAEQISEDVEKMAKLRDFKLLAENIYNQACISACLDGVEGVDYETTNDVKIINILLDNNGKYTLADVDRKWGIPTIKFSEPYLFTNVRGRRIQITNTDFVNKEFISKFMSEAVIPELNAYRFAYIAGNLGVNNGMTYDKLLKESDEKDIITFVSGGAKKMSLLNEKVVPVSQFYTGIDLFDGISEKEQSGGFAKHIANYEGDTDSKALKYLAINKKALFTVVKFDLKFIGDMLAFVVYHDVIVRDKYKHLVCSEVF